MGRACGSKEHFLWTFTPKWWCDVDKTGVLLHGPRNGTAWDASGMPFVWRCCPTQGFHAGAMLLNQ